MITTNQETLRLKSMEFKGSPEELKVIIQALEDDLATCQMKGVGLSAIQIGIPQRIAIIRYKEKIKTYGEKREIEVKRDLYNTIILEKKHPFIYEGEGCLSCPDTFLNTQRYNWIKIRNGDGTESVYSGFDAVLIQHELDHWEGVLITDRKVENL